MITLFVPQEAFTSWGWRIPFLASIIILAIGLWIRLSVSETPQFEEIQRNRAANGAQKERPPIGEVFARYPWKTLTATFVIVGSSAVAYLYLTFILSWGGKTVGYPTPVILGAICVGAVLWAASAPIWGSMGDRPGGMRRLFLGWGIVRTLSVIPFFLMVGTGNVFLLYIAMAAMGVVISATQVPAGAAIASLYPVNVRYTGTSFAFQFGSILGGGLTPVIAAVIVATSWGINGVMAYVCLISILSAAAGLLFSKHRIDTPSSDLDDSTADETVREPA
jgi:MFS family permease